MSIQDSRLLTIASRHDNYIETKQTSTTIHHNLNKCWSLLRSKISLLYADTPDKYNIKTSNIIFYLPCPMEKTTLCSCFKYFYWICDSFRRQFYSMIYVFSCLCIVPQNNWSVYKSNAQSMLRHWMFARILS